MRWSLILLIVCSVAKAETAYTTSVENVYRLSCERSMLRIFTKYGAGDWSGPHQESFTVKFCSGLISTIDKAKAWKDIDSPAGTACMDVVKTVIKTKGYPAKDDLFSEFCYSITKKDG